MITLEQTFNQIKRFNPKSNQINSQIKYFLNSKEIKIDEIGNYYLMTFDTEYFISKKDFTIYKSFINKDDAINYCLDKINTESNQQPLF